MSTLKMFKVYMIMDRGGQTCILLGAMNRAHATILARLAHPNWHCTGQVEEVN